ncbi:MAG: glutathione S-transferase family protein [Gammaproteobacteria bacterium]
MNRIPYQIVETLPPKAPRGKLPFIEDGGKHIADSRLILHHLQAQYGTGNDADLSPSQQAAAKAIQRLLEEHLYWASMATRWDYSDSNWQAIKQAIFGVLPPFVRDVVASAYRRRIKGQILGHGIGRLNRDEIFALGKEDIDTLAIFLGEKSYFMGDKPTSVDASAYGMLVNIIACPIESPLKDHALSKQNLHDYCRSMQAEFYPELPWRSA